MAQVIADRRDVDFVLFEQIEVEQFLKYEKYKEFNRKMFELVVSEAKTFAVKEILQTYAEGDREGVKFDRGKVKVPSCLHRPNKLLIEGEWNALSEDPAMGGQGIPHIISIAANEAEKAAEIDIVQVQALGRYGRFFMSGSEASVQTALEAATTAIGMVEGVETASQ